MLNFSWVGGSWFGFVVVCFYRQISHSPGRSLFLGVGKDDVEMILMNHLAPPGGFVLFIVMVFVLFHKLASTSDPLASVSECWLVPLSRLSFNPSTNLLGFYFTYEEKQAMLFRRNYV